MEIEEAIRECPQYGHCCYGKSGIMVDEPKCKSGDPQTYISCERYDPFIAYAVMDIEKLEALGLID